MNKIGKGHGFLIFILIIIVLLVWGFIGGQQAHKAGVTCDIHLGDTFCWKWHTLGEIVKDTGNAVKDFVNN